MEVILIALYKVISCSEVSTLDIFFFMGAGYSIESAQLMGQGPVRTPTLDIKFKFIFISSHILNVLVVKGVEKKGREQRIRDIAATMRVLFKCKSIQAINHTIQYSFGYFLRSYSSNHFYSASGGELEVYLL